MTLLQEWFKTEAPGHPQERTESDFATAMCAIRGFGALPEVRLGKSFQDVRPSDLKLSSFGKGIKFGARFVIFKLQGTLELLDPKSKNSESFREGPWVEIIHQGPKQVTAWYTSGDNRLFPSYASDLTDFNHVNGAPMLVEVNGERCRSNADFSIAVMRALLQDGRVTARWNRAIKRVRLDIPPGVRHLACHRCGCAFHECECARE